MRWVTNFEEKMTETAGNSGSKKGEYTVIYTFKKNRLYHNYFIIQRLFYIKIFHRPMRSWMINIKVKTRKVKSRRQRKRSLNQKLQNRKLICI